MLMNEEINCHKAELLITPFLENVLSGEDLADFLRHVENCKGCYEELETRYLIFEALSRLENGETIDLKRELAEKISSTKRILRLHMRTTALRQSLEMIAGIIISFGIVYYLLDYFHI